jgi:hypothetical protein
MCAWIDTYIHFLITFTIIFLHTQHNTTQHNSTSTSTHDNHTMDTLDSPDALVPNGATPHKVKPAFEEAVVPSADGDVLVPEQEQEEQGNAKSWDEDTEGIPRLQVVDENQRFT